MTTTEEITVPNRAMAGSLLAKKLDRYSRSEVIIFGIPRGGVIVAASIAEALGLRLNVLPCRKIVHPGNSERSIGSVSLEDVFLSSDCQDIPRDYIGHQIALLRSGLRSELSEYEEKYYPVSVQDKTIIVVDDLSQSGDTLMACLRSLKKQQPLRIVVAVPFISAKSIRRVEALADEVVFLRMDHVIKSGCDYYIDFDKITVSDVKARLKHARQEVDFS
jgi:putative phosphoribosyl transferase